MTNERESPVLCPSFLSGVMSVHVFEVWEHDNDNIMGGNLLKNSFGLSCLSDQRNVRSFFGISVWNYNKDSVHISS